MYRLTSTSPSTPRLGGPFDRWMTRQSELHNPAILAALDLTGVATVADIGGGQGSLLGAILQANPSMTGILLDLPHVVADPVVRDARAPAIVSLDEWREVQGRAETKGRSRRAPSERRGRQRTEYLFRSLLRCGCCGLRMWGAPPPSRYYLCQPSHQRPTAIPADDLRRREAFGRSRHRLPGDRRVRSRPPRLLARGPLLRREARGRHSRTSPRGGAGERRIQRQVVALEELDTTPALRRRFAERIAELEAFVAEKSKALVRLCEQVASAGPISEEVTELLDTETILTRAQPDALPQAPPHRSG